MNARRVAFRRVAARAGLRFLLYAAVAVPVLTSLPTYLDEFGGPAWWTTDPAVAVLADIHDCAARIDAEVPAGALVLRFAGRVEYVSLDEGWAVKESGGPDRTIAWCET